MPDMNILQQFKSITCFVFDMDGVLTDGMLLVLPDGLMARSMNIKDGLALQLAVKKGYHVLVISGGNAPEVKERLLKLGVKQVWMQVGDKKAVLKEYLETHGLVKEQVLYMGDDVPDWEVMHMAGIRACPADAAIDILADAQYISTYKGGEGCARDVIEKVMKLRADWETRTDIKAQ